MSKKIVNELKTQVKKSEYTNLRSAKETLDSGDRTYLDMNFNGEYEFAHDFVINGKVITSDCVNNLYLKHENLILKDEKEKENYRLFLKTVFTEMFWRAGAKIPNNPIMEEFITYYNRSGYISSVSFQDLLSPFGLRIYSLKLLIPSYKERVYMSCNDSSCLKFSFSANEGAYDNQQGLICDLQNSVEFKLKCEGENVKYEEGKVSLTIPKELKNYKVSGKNLLDVIVEHFQKFCEKLGFNFETKVEHSLGEPLKVLNDINTSQNKDSNLNQWLNNPR